MTSKRLPTWAWVLLGNVVAAVIGGVVVVHYSDWSTPAPGLTGNGELVLYVPQPATLPELKAQDLELWSFWRVTIRNTGSRPARNARLSFPRSHLAISSVGVKEAERDGGFSSLNLGDLDPGQELRVFGWIRPTEPPSIRDFALTHSEGYGEIGIESIPAYAERADRLQRVSDFILWTAIATLLVVFAMTWTSRFTGRS